MCATEYMNTNTHPAVRWEKPCSSPFLCPFPVSVEKMTDTDWDGCLTDRCCISALCQLLTVHTTNLRNMKWFSLSLFRTNTRLLSPSLPRAPFCQHTRRRSKKKMMIFTVTQVCVATSLRNIEKERENSDAPYMRKGQVYLRERDFPARHNWLGDSWRPSVSRRGCISLAGRRRPTIYKQQLTFSSLLTCWDFLCCVLLLLSTTEYGRRWNEE